MNSPRRKRHWQHAHDNRLPLISTKLSERLQQWDLEHPGAIPDLTQCQALLIASDYGGDEQRHPFRTYSFMIVDWGDRAAWNDALLLIREDKNGLGERTMSYKDLRRDERRREALPPFLHAVQQFKGLTLTIAIEERRSPIDDLLVSPMPSHSCSTAYDHWHRATRERFRIITHLLSLLTRGFSHDGQQVIWVTDNDRITQKPTDEFNAFGLCIMKKYVPWDLDFGWVTPKRVIERPGTPTEVIKDTEAEDYAAIPDLLAGVFSDWLAHLDGELTTPTGELVMPKMEPATAWRVRSAFKGLSVAGQSMRHIYIRIRVDEHGDRIMDTLLMNPEIRRRDAPLHDPSNQ